MLKRLQLAIDYLFYFFSSGTQHDVHSPFVYNFVTKVLRARKNKPAYHSIELIRTKMLRSNAPIEVLPLGAKTTGKTSYIPLKKLVAKTSKSAKYGELLERICEYFEPQYALEIGSSLGISTLYQASGIHNGYLISLEGNPKSLEIAQHNIDSLGMQHVQFGLGLFDDTLPMVIEQVPQLDYVFFDGNHSLDATLRYFEWCLKKAHSNSVFIFDDIRWSEEMNRAWQKIKNHPSVMVSIDLFFMGIVFFRTEQAKEHFTLRF